MVCGVLLIFISDLINVGELLFLWNPGTFCFKFRLEFLDSFFVSSGPREGHPISVFPRVGGQNIIKRPLKRGRLLVSPLVFSQPPPLPPPPHYRLP